MTGARAVRDLQERSRMERGRPVRFARQARLTGLRDGGGDGSGDCDCSHCVGGVTMPASSTVCCESHPAFSMTCPLTGEERLLKWQTGNHWATDPFQYETENGCSNEYEWAMDVAAIPAVTLLALELAVDNGCDKACVIYECAGFACLCDNVFTIRPQGGLTNVARSAITCKVCIKPTTQTVGCGACLNEVAPEMWVVNVDTDLGTDLCSAAYCDIFEGIHVLTETSSCRWIKEIDSEEECGTAPFTLREPGYHVRLILFDPSFGGGDLEFMSRSQTKTEARYRLITNEIPECLSEDCLEFTFSEALDGCPDWPATLLVCPLGENTIPTSDGACAGCGEPDVADPDAEGACCTGNAGCLDISETDCTFFGGEWFATDAECDSTCSTVGSCCYCGNDIILCASNAELSFCNHIGGVWDDTELNCESECGGTLFESCVEGDPLGACFIGEECQGITNEGDCAGTWYEGDTCSEVTPDPVGCCTDDSTILNCEDLTEAECLAAHPVGWTWTAGGVCDPGTPSCIV